VKGCTDGATYSGTAVSRTRVSATASAWSKNDVADRPRSRSKTMKDMVLPMTPSIGRVVVGNMHNSVLCTLLFESISVTTISINYYQTLYYNYLRSKLWLASRRAECVDYSSNVSHLQNRTHSFKRCILITQPMTPSVVSMPMATV